MRAVKNVNVSKYFVGGAWCYGNKTWLETVQKNKMATENFVARRSESADAESISSMVARQTENIFGRTDVEMVM